MAKFLYTNGCSWTWGGALKDSNGNVFGVHKDSSVETWEEAKERLTKLWPHHLGEMLGVENTYNLSLGCGSNQRIFRTTFEWLHKQDKEDLQNTVAVIQLTEPSRFEFYYGDDKNYQSDLWAGCNVNSIVNYQRQINKKEYLNCRLQQYTWHEGFYDTLSCVISLISLFKEFKLKEYYFWSHIPNILPKIEKVITVPTLYLSEYDNVGEVEDVNGNTFWDYHPSETGHTEIAKQIYEKIK